MPLVPADPSVTDRTPEMLVCVYYRVAAGDSTQVISGVREFQRTLPSGIQAGEAEVLLRCDLPSQAAPPATSPDARAASPPSHAPAADPGADATVMETYRLRLPLAGADADAAVRDFLTWLDAASSPLASLLRGARHVELFSPCAS
jgi:hypothetical protein